MTTILGLFRTPPAATAAMATFSSEDLEVRFKKATEPKEISSLASALGQTIHDLHRLICLLKLAEETGKIELEEICQRYVARNQNDCKSLLFLLIVDGNLSLVQRVLNWPPAIVGALLTCKDSCNQGCYHKLKETGQLQLAKQCVTIANITKLFKEVVGNANEELGRLLDTPTQSSEMDDLIVEIAKGDSISPSLLLLLLNYPSLFARILALGGKEIWDKGLVFSCLQTAIREKRVSAINTLREHQQKNRGTCDFEPLFELALSTQDPDTVAATLNFRSSPTDVTHFRRALDQPKEVFAKVWATINFNVIHDCRKIIVSQDRFFNLAEIVFPPDYDSATVDGLLIEMAMRGSLIWFQFMLTRAKNANCFYEVTHLQITHEGSRVKTATIFQLLFFFNRPRDFFVALGSDPHRIHHPSVIGNYIRFPIQNPILLSHSAINISIPMQLWIARKQVEKGHDLTEATYSPVHTALRQAIQQGLLIDVYSLLESAPYLLFHKNADGVEPLKACAAGSFEATLQAFVRAALVTPTSSYAEHLLIWCAEHYLKNYCQQLLKGGVNPHASYKGRTMLFPACEAELEKSVEELLSLGLDINHKDSNGKTPLFIMVETNKTTMALFLLKKNANCDLESINKDRPLHWAVVNQNEDLVKALVERNASRTLTGAGSESPLSTAIRIDQTNKTATSRRIVALLEEPADCKQQ